MSAASHPAIELLARYRAVFKAAWQARHDLAGPKRLADEAAFLPAALSLQETPVHPAPRRAMWVVMTLFMIALVWSMLGEVDIVAVATGRITVSDGTKVIQPLDSAVVKAIHVKDGDRVKAGQVLVELDATAASADTRSVQEQLRATDDEARRSEALLGALRTGRALAPSLGSQLHAEWQDIVAKSARLEAELTRRQAELSTHREVLAKLKATLPLARQREADFKALSEQGFMAGHAGQDRMRERIELERDVATQQARIHEGEAALAETRRSQLAFRAEIERTLTERLNEARLKRHQLANEGEKNEYRERLTRLVAPVSGTVQQLAVHTTGGVVTPAQPILVVVPDDAEVIAEVVVDNKDIGFVHEGQEAEIKLETFNFTRYGTVPATVVHVSADAVQDKERGAVFMASLRLSQRAIPIDGRAVRLAPGMNVTAEVRTGTRTLIDFLLGPLRQKNSESLRER